MKTFLLVLAILLALLVTEAWASCTTAYITLPSGRMMICTTCCYPAFGCTTTCF